MVHRNNNSKLDDVMGLLIENGFVKGCCLYYKSEIRIPRLCSGLAWGLNKAKQPRNKLRG